MLQVNQCSAHQSLKMQIFVLSIFLFAHFSSANNDRNIQKNKMPDLFYFEDYQKCLHSSEDAVYCTLTVRLTPKNVSAIWDMIYNFSLDSNNYRHDLLRHGICASEKCVHFNESIEQCLNQIYSTQYENLGLVGEITKTHCETVKSMYQIQKSDLILTVIVAFYLVFVLLTSIYLQITKDNKKISPVRSFLSCFSLTQNFHYLFSKKANTFPNYMHFFDGIRCLLVVGVIVTHVTETNLVIPVANPGYAEEVPTRFITALLANGGMTVQIYFVISFFLLSVSFFQKIKDGPIGFSYVLKNAIRRILKLTPAYAFLIFLHSTWLVHMFRGPFWDPIMGEDFRVCRTNWWKNLLYFNNFVINEGLCMFHSWYLSVDLQFTILGSFILWMVQKKPKLIFVIGGLIVAFQVSYLFFTLSWNHFEPAVVMKPEILQSFKIIYSKEWQANWTTTYSHLASLVSGLCFGYIYHHTDRDLKNKWTKTLWCILFSSLTFGPLLISSCYITSRYYSHSYWFAASFGSVSNALFAFGFGLFIFGMAKDLGGIFKNVLEFDLLCTAGKLSFGAYLVHFTLLKIAAGSQNSPPYASDYKMIVEIFTNVSMSLVCSVFLSLFIIMPFTILAIKIQHI